MNSKWFTLLTCISLSSCVLGDINTTNRVSVRLEASWNSTNFLVNLIESVSGYDESLYFPIIETIFGLTEEENDFELYDVTEQEVYTRVIEKVGLSDESTSFVNFNLVNKIYTPRIVSHYEYYTNKVLTQFEKRLNVECARDSFGNEVERDSHGKLQTWLLYNNKFYCSASDLFALQTDSTEVYDVLQFDRVIGDNTKAPLLILYGNPASLTTKEFFVPLYHDAKAGKIRFLWRYIPPSGNQLAESLSGYGVELSLKNKDYHKDGKKVSALDLTKDFKKVNESKELLPVPENKLDQIGLKFTSFVLSNTKDKYELLRTMLNNFPKFLAHVANIPKLMNYEQVKANVFANEDLGVSQESYGFYINGSPIHPLELGILSLSAKLQTELKIVKDLIKLGFSTIQSKLLITKFALLSAVKQTQFRTGNTLMGNNENRFRVFENTFSKRTKGGVVFFNDIEKDVTYDNYSTDRQDTYLGPSSFRLKPNQIPPLKENIHDLIFALNFANKNQLKVFFTLSKVILDTGIPQQVGLIPLIGDDPMDKTIADAFYFLVQRASSKEALAFLYKYLESKNEDDANEILKLIPKSQKLKFDYSTVLNKFSIDTPSVIFNGVINELSSSNWQITMGKQLSQDINLIKSRLREGVNMSLKELIYSNAKTERNLRIVPLEPSEILYKPIDREIQDKSVVFRSMDKSDDVGYTFWLFSSFNEQSMVDQLVSLLEIVKKRSEDLQVRVVNTGTTFTFLEKLSKKYKLNMLTNSQINEVIEELKQVEIPREVSLNTAFVKFLEKKQIPVNHSFMLINSRYFRLDNPFTATELEQIVIFEHSQRLKLFNDILETYPDKYDKKRLVDFNIGLDPSDWFDLVCSIVTKSFHVDEKLFVVDVNRFDFGALDMSNSIDIGEKESPVDVLLIVDPVSEYSQKMVSILESIRDFPFVSIRILLQPKVNPEFHIGRFYQGVYPASTPQFDGHGNWISRYGTENESLPSDENLSIGLDVPNRWHTTTKSVSNNIDVSNVKVTEGFDVKFELMSIVHEGYARDIHTAMAPSGLAFNLDKDNVHSDTSVMSTLNYFQIRTTPGIWKLSLFEKEKFDLLSCSENKFDANQEALQFAEIFVFSLRGLTLYPRVTTKDKSVSKEKSKKQADINIFSIAGGGEYEQLLGIMMASVRKHNTKSVKFWLLDNYMSPQFKALLPILADKYNLEYELVTYKWPNWLRKQKEKHRSIWGYKILFLDVLFPQDLDNVIFIDADQICRTDLTELVNLDLEGAPYGFTPMCDSRKEMGGFRFWKQGYWSEVLKDDLKYHISALFVVDLKKFREINAGDRLRSHYQKLSSDPNSLSNLDQDLPNNMQRSVKIFSLPQEWLWCETWCANDSLPSAKMIDLCNNPLTKENKFDIAKRLIPEWKDYNNEIQKLYEEVANTSEIVYESGDDGISSGQHEQKDDDDSGDSDYHDEL